MPRGGRRPGAGRPKTKGTPAGKLNERLREKVLADGTTPLQVMLEAMKAAYESGGAEAAVKYARECAPYIHPKLASTNAEVSAQVSGLDGKPLTDLDVARRIAFALQQGTRGPDEMANAPHSDTVQ